LRSGIILGAGEYNRPNHGRWRWILYV